MRDIYKKIQDIKNIYEFGDWSYLSNFELRIEDVKEGKEDLKKKAIKEFRNWLSREWKYFKLSSYLEKCPGITLHPLSFVKDSVTIYPSVKDSVTIYPKRKFKCEISGYENTIYLFDSTCKHEVWHMLQPVVNEYISNEIILYKIAELLSNESKPISRKWVENLRKNRLKEGEVKFLETTPTGVQLIYLDELDKELCGLVLSNIQNNPKHGDGFKKIFRLAERDEELVKIYDHLNYFKIMSIDEAEKEAISLRKEGYTVEDLPELYGKEFLKYSEEIDSALSKLTGEGRSIVEERMKLFIKIWEVFSKAKNLEQLNNRFKNFLNFIIIKDGKKYYVYSAAKPEYVEVLVTYLSDVFIAKKIVDEALKGRDFEKAIRGSCIWRKNEVQFNCHKKGECKHEKKPLDLII